MPQRMSNRLRFMSASDVATQATSPISIKALILSAPCARENEMTDKEKIEALISVLKYLIESSDKYIEESSWLSTLNADIHLAKTTIKHIEEN